MIDIDMSACTALVRTTADAIAERGPQCAENAAITDVIAHVRAVSQDAETTMRLALAALYPAIGWTSEENRPARQDYWLYDPIDGAYHWLQGLPLWASSLVLVRNGEPVVSIVYDPSLKEAFVAVAGNGANCNGEPIGVSSKSALGAAVVGTAVPPLAQVGEVEQDEALELLRSVARSVFVVRPMAAASLQLAYVAAGRLDGYVENGNDAADWLAGSLLIREAGGVVTDLAGDAFGWSGDGILSANAVLHSQMCAAIGRDKPKASNFV